MIYRRSGNRPVFWALLLIVIGVVALIDNLGLGHLDLGDLISQWWPVIPIYFGLMGVTFALLRQGSGRGIMWGSLVVNALFTAFFVNVLGNNHDWWSFDPGNWLFPLLLVVIGLSLLLRGPGTRPGARTYWAIMFGTRPQPGQWEDTTAVALMGGVQVDLSQAGLPDREVLIDAYALMGGITIYVPEGVRVETEWAGFMGGMNVFGQHAGAFVDQRRMAEGSGPVVRVRGQSILGGINVKRV